MSSGTASTGSTNWYSVSQYRADEQAASQIAPKKDLDKNSFLQLLVTQLKNQDPTDPMKNQDFIAQLAQFSSLEQMNNVASGMGQVSLSNSIGTAVSLIGKSITALDPNGNQITGVVSGMKMIQGKANVLIGDQLIDLGSIQSVSQT